MQPLPTVKPHQNNSHNVKSELNKTPWRPTSWESWKSVFWDLAHTVYPSSVVSIPSLLFQLEPSRADRNETRVQVNHTDLGYVECVCSCCTSNQSSRSEQGCFPLHYDVNFLANGFLYTPHNQRFHSWFWIFASPLYNRRGWLGDKNQLPVWFIWNFCRQNFCL